MMLASDMSQIARLWKCKKGRVSRNQVITETVNCMGEETRH